MSKRHKKIERDLTGRLIRVGRHLISVTLEGRFLWMILVPVAHNDGLVFTDRHHKRFYDRVLKISGGSTENDWSNGKWICGRRLYNERMIPLEFLATTAQADKIAAFALVHYDQIEIQCRPIGDRVRVYRRADQTRHSNPLTRVGKTIWRRVRRIGRKFCNKLGSSRTQGLAPVADATRPSPEISRSSDSNGQGGNQ